MSYLSEKYQLGPLRYYLNDEDIDFVIEPVIFSLPIDILGVKKDITYSIELKTKDFKRGIEQATRNTSFVDYSYISVYEQCVTEHLLERIEDSPVGLLSVSDSVEPLFPPERNTPSQHAKSRVLEVVNNDVRKHNPVQSQG